MKGTPSTIATRDDLEILVTTDLEAAKRFAAWLAGTASRTVNVQQYPGDYSASSPDDAGYLPPMIEHADDLTTLRRYDFADLAELEHWVVVHSGVEA